MSRVGLLGKNTERLQLISFVPRLTLLTARLESCTNGTAKKKEKGADLGWIISTGLSAGAYSPTLSHYCQARALLSAAFLPWTGSNLIVQPGRVPPPRTRPC